MPVRRQEDDAAVAEITQSDQIRRLGLRIDVLDWSHGLASQPVVTILVDGQEIFARLAGQGYQGWHPAAILDPDVAALLPARPARRVGLYGWDSYYGAGEGCIAAVITGHGDHVIWSDLRDFCGDYHSPTTEHDPDPRSGQHTSIADIVFDAAQYRAEIARVSAGLPWETENVTMLRLLRRSLDREKDYLARLGWKLDFAQMGPAGFWIAFLDDDHAQTIVELPAGPGTPDEQAAAMAGYLFATPPQQWPVAHCSNCDRSSDADADRPAQVPSPPARPSRHPAHGPSARGRRRG